MHHLVYGSGSAMFDLAHIRTPELELQIASCNLEAGQCFHVSLEKV
jgi:hypothetical protein